MLIQTEAQNLKEGSRRSQVKSVTAHLICLQMPVTQASIVIVNPQTELDHFDEAVRRDLSDKR